MNRKQKIIFWLPRILSLGYVIFLSLFALDVFEGKFEWTMILAFIIHLLPAFILLAAVIIAWKYELFGAIIFFAFAIGYILMAGLGRSWSWYAAISLPSAIVAIAFLLSWRQRKSFEKFD